MATVERTIKRSLIPLVGSYINRNINPSSFTTKEQEFINCYPEVYTNPITGTKKAYIQKRPGSVVSNSLSIAGVTKGGLGSCLWTGNSSLPIVASFITSTPGLRFYVPGATAQAIGGEVTGVTQCVTVSETKIGSTATLIALCVEETSGDLELYYYQPSGAWTQITDADFLAITLSRNAPAFMNGYIFVMATDGSIWNSDLNSVTAWTSTSSIVAQGHPDNGVGLARYKNTIVGFGRFSTEFFYNADNATGSPLKVIDNSIIKIGALTASTNRTIIEVGDTVYWIGVEADTSKIGIYRLNNFQPEKVSNVAIDKLCNEGTITGIVGTFTSHGLSHIMFTGGHCFCIDTGFWWQYVQGSSFTFASIVGSNGKYYFANSDADQYYAWLSENNTSYTDNSVAYTMSTITMPIDLDTNVRKFWDSISILGDIDSGVSLSISYSDDDYANFSTARTLALGSGFSKLTHLGQSRRRVWKITEASANPVRLESMELTYRLAAN